MQEMKVVSIVQSPCVRPDMVGISSNKRQNRYTPFLRKCLFSASLIAIPYILHVCQFYINHVVKKFVFGWIQLSL